MPQSSTDGPLMRLPAVVALTGLSKSEIYRQVSEGRFPRQHPYPGMKKATFWIDDEVREWRACAVDGREWRAPPIDEFDELLKPTPPSR